MVKRASAAALRQVDGSEAKAEAQSIPKGKKSAGNWAPRLEDV